MSVIFKAIPTGGKLNFLNRIDLEKFCIEFDNKEVIVEIKEYAKSGPKQKLYAYYHAVVLECAYQAYRASGDMADRVEVDFKLRAELAKTFVKNLKGEYIAALEEKKDMTKPRLLEYVTDVIMFLQTNFNVQVPDSQEYLMERKTGKKFTAVQGGKEKPDNFIQL